MRTVRIMPKTGPNARESDPEHRAREKQRECEDSTASLSIPQKPAGKAEERRHGAAFHHTSDRR
jgi:hypothetical protein